MVSRGASEGVWRISLRCLNNVLRVSGDTVKGVWSQDRSSQDRPSQVWSGQVRSGQVKSSQIRSTHVKSKLCLEGVWSNILIWTTQLGFRVLHS